MWLTGISFVGLLFLSIIFASVAGRETQPWDKWRAYTISLFLMWSAVHMLLLAWEVRV